MHFLCKREDFEDEVVDDGSKQKECTGEDDCCDSWRTRLRVFPEFNGFTYRTRIAFSGCGGGGGFFFGRTI